MSATEHLLTPEPPAAAALRRGFPWRRPRRERIVLVLVALASLTPVYVVSSQDLSRLCLTRAIVAGRLTISPCVGKGVDRARYQGRTYSDKAPGMSFLAVPAAVLSDLPAPTEWHFNRDFHVWTVRLLTSGLAFLLLAFMIGRTAEGIAAGSGALVAVSVALGTLTGGLAATTFDQVTAAALGFSAFLIAWRGQPGRAGLLAGLAVTVEYQAALIAAAVAVYLMLTSGRRCTRYFAGLAAGAVALGLYDWAAFGSPFHLSYRYVANGYTNNQRAGFFGLSFPRWHAIETVLIGDRGLLIASPVLLAASVGLVLLARTHRWEAATCAVITVAYLALEFCYFLPYGGISPGPRFLIPALPFLGLGLAPAFQQLKRLTGALALLSVLASTTLALTWSWGSSLGYRQTIWGELLRALTRAHSRLRYDLTSNVLTWAGLSPTVCAFAVALSACLALAAAWNPTRERRAWLAHARPQPTTDRGLITGDLETVDGRP